MKRALAAVGLRRLDYADAELAAAWQVQGLLPRIDVELASDREGRAASGRNT